MYGKLFDKEAQQEADQILNVEGKELVNKHVLSRIRWNQSMEATHVATIKGKNQVLYHPIMIRFAMMLRQKLNKGTYEFVAGTLNLPSSRLIANYDSVDASSKDSVLFEVVRTMNRRLKESIKRAGSIKCTVDC